MSQFILFFKLLQANLKRLKHYIWHIIISIVILLTICSIAGLTLTKLVYKQESPVKVNIAYYLPDDEDKRFNNFGLSFIKEQESTKEIVGLIQVETIEEGYQMLEQGQALYYIIIPESFFSGIMDGTNPELTIVIKDKSSVAAYVSNELFSSYARYLGVAQAGVYSAIDTTIQHQMSSEDVSNIQDTVNLTFLDRSLNKENYLNTVDASSQGSYSLIEHYLASALMLCLFFVTFVLMPYLQGIRKGLYTKLTTCKINIFHILLINILSTIPALYIAYLPCYITISILCKSFNPIGFICVLPTIIIISIIVNVISILCKNEFTANMIILAVTLVIAYIGGGILPKAMLPSAIQSISSYLPGQHMITNIAAALFG